MAQGNFPVPYRMTASETVFNITRIRPRIRDSAFVSQTNNIEEATVLAFKWLQNWCDIYYKGTTGYVPGTFKIKRSHRLDDIFKLVVAAGASQGMAADALYLMIAD
jgi:hypothetical protein